MNAKVFAVLMCLVNNVQGYISSTSSQDNFWYDESTQEIFDAIKAAHHNDNVAKNIILFVGDGMGMSTVTAARIFKGQKQGRPGEEDKLFFERFPHVGLAKTYSMDKQVSDSASTATAMMAGVKVNFNTIGVDSTVKQGDCYKSLDPNTHVDSIAKWAQEVGMDTGFVTTTRVTHATPAGLYAHTSDRTWESDIHLPPDNIHCKDITRQLVEDEPGKHFKVILGGGSQTFLPDDGLKDRSNTFRRDGRNLVRAWAVDKLNRDKSYKVVATRDQLMNVDFRNTDFLLGLFDPSHLPFEVYRNYIPKEKQVPRLSEMVKAAIDMLSKSPTGYFLMVEGGRIDQAHHMNQARKALEEVMSFDEAIETAVKNTNVSDTLIIVTADHSHTLTINGYPEKGADILGLVENGDRDYTTLMYTNGPGFYRKYEVKGASQVQPVDLRNSDTSHMEFQQLAGVSRQDIKSSHAGEDVPIYAIGPMSHLFHGVHEQTFIAHVMSYSACIGPRADFGRCGFLRNYYGNANYRKRNADLT